MTLHQMHIFQKIIETQSFSSAGEELYLSEPSISAQFKSFEKSLGLNLIDRHQSSNAKGIVLTEDGYIVYESVQKILNEYNKILEFSKKQRSKNPDIKIVSNSPVGTYLLPKLLSSYNKLNPNIKIQLSVETNYYNLTNLANSYSYDICFTPLYKKISREDIVYSFKTQIDLVTSNRDAFVNERFPLNKINDLSLITPPIYSVVRKVLRNFFDELSLTLKSTMELDHSESAKRVLLENDNYYALLSSITIRDELKTGKLRAIQTEPPLPSIEYVIVKRDDKSKRPLISNLLSYMIDHLDNFFSKDY